MRRLLDIMTIIFIVIDLILVAGSVNYVIAYNTIDVYTPFVLIGFTALVVLLGQISNWLFDKENKK